MPEYLSPGVYVEEVDTGPKPIAGVSTSTAGAVGVTRRGPTEGPPVLVTSFAEFVRTFGSFMKDPPSGLANQWKSGSDGGHFWQFPHAVRGFFDNGGQRLYVKRVFADTAEASSAPFGRGLVAHVAADAPVGNSSVKLEHIVGIARGTSLRFFNGKDGTALGSALDVASYDASRGTVTLDDPLTDELMVRRGDFAEIRSRSASPVPASERTLVFRARARGEWGNDLWVGVKPRVGNVLNILHDPDLPGSAFTTTVVSATSSGGPTPTWTVEVDDASGLSDDDHVLIDGQEHVIDGVDGTANTVTIEREVPGLPPWPPGVLVQRLRAANTAGSGNSLILWGGSQLYRGALVELDNGREKEHLVVDDVDGDTIEFSGTLSRAYFEGHKARVIEADVEVEYRVDGEVEASETFSSLRLGDAGSPSHLLTHVNEHSELVSVEAAGGFSATNLERFPTAPGGGLQRLAGGDDKLADLTVDDFRGEDGPSGKRTGIQALEEIDDISLCVAPGMWSGTIQAALTQHCEALKDRFAILDPKVGLDTEGVRAFRAPVDTRYAALYYPWVRIRDPLTGNKIAVAPSGHMAGLYARVDVERGVHKAPANEVIRGIDRDEGLEQIVTKRHHDMLNPVNINVLRFFPGRGNRVWGARVLTSDASWKYVNVRRLFIFVEKSIYVGTQWVVFEPNDEPLWARVRQTITNFLTTVWRNGALEGATQEEAFFVRCDRSTMTQAEIDNGQLICIIGIAPVKPAEFVIFRIQQKTREAV